MIRSCRLSNDPLASLVDPHSYFHTCLYRLNHSDCRLPDAGTTGRLHRDDLYVYAAYTRRLTIRAVQCSAMLSDRRLLDIWRRCVTSLNVHWVRDEYFSDLLALVAQLLQHGVLDELILFHFRLSPCHMRQLFLLCAGYGPRCRVMSDEPWPLRPDGHDVDLVGLDGPVQGPSRVYDPMPGLSSTDSPLQGPSSSVDPVQGPSSVVDPLPSCSSVDREQTGHVNSEQTECVNKSDEPCLIQSDGIDIVGLDARGVGPVQGPSCVYDPMPGLGSIDIPVQGPSSSVDPVQGSSSVNDPLPSCSSINIEQTEHVNIEQAEHVNIEKAEHVNIEQAEHVNIEQAEHVNIEQAEHVNIEQAEHVNIEQAEHVSIEQAEHVNIEQAEHVNIEQEERVNIEQAEHVNIEYTEHINIEQTVVNTDQTEHMNIEPSEPVLAGVAQGASLRDAANLALRNLITQYSAVEGANESLPHAMGFELDTETDHLFDAALSTCEGKPMGNPTRARCVTRALGSLGVITSPHCSQLIDILLDILPAWRHLHRLALYSACKYSCFI